MITEKNEEITKFQIIILFILFVICFTLMIDAQEFTGIIAFIFLEESAFIF